MNVTLPIPDDLAVRLGRAGDVSRRALEAFATEEYRAGRLTGSELRRLLGFATRCELQSFLRIRGIAEDVALDAGEREQHDREVVASDVVARFQAFRADKTLGGLDPVELIRRRRQVAGSGCVTEF